MEKNAARKKSERNNRIRRKSFLYPSYPSYPTLSYPIPQKGHVRYTRTVRKVSEDHIRGLLNVVYGVHGVHGETYVEMHKGTI